VVEWETTHLNRVGRQVGRVAHPSQPMKWVPHPSRLSSDGWESTNLNQCPRLYSQIQPRQSRFTESCAGGPVINQPQL